MMTPVLAYLDPGSGSMLLQMLLGSVMAVGLFFYQSIARVLGIFRRSPKPGDEKPGVSAPKCDRQPTA